MERETDLKRLPDHPAAQAELLHLQTTCDAIAREIREVEALTGAKAGVCMDVQMKEDPDEQEEVTLQRFRYQLDRLRQLSMASGQAYFARHAAARRTMLSRRNEAKKKMSLAWNTPSPTCALASYSLSPGSSTVSDPRTKSARTPFSSEALNVPGGSFSDT